MLGLAATASSGLADLLAYRFTSSRHENDCTAIPTRLSARLSASKAPGQQTSRGEIVKWLRTACLMVSIATDTYTIHQRALYRHHYSPAVLARPLKDANRCVEVRFFESILIRQPSIQHEHQLRADSWLAQCPIQCTNSKSLSSSTS